MKNAIPELPDRVGFMRRILAFIADTLLVIALELIFSAIVFGGAWILNQLGILHIESSLEQYVTEQSIYQLLVWAILIVYFVYGWSYRGQTLAMRWLKMRVQNVDGSNISITQALIRLFTSIFGLGNFTVLFDPAQHLAFQDHWAKCEVIDLRKC
ncbi:RDD family protein [Celerinatantimonas sp. YJH-8]|uniref:RDD family protein n=1 Tax=Celerinatantimonas sp. YJH-8 TaxID=3228714 RepID=UPI0038C2AD92